MKSAMSRREERSLIEAMTTPPAMPVAPDLGRLRALLAATVAEGQANLPWWLDSAPGGDEDGYDGTTTIGGIVAGYERTERDHEGKAIGTEPAVAELGSIDPPIAQALAVAAVNALPWLLAELDRARAEALGVTMRGDRVDAWLRRNRDRYKVDSTAWFHINRLLDDYRDHADTGTPLSEEVRYAHDEDEPDLGPGPGGS